MKNRKLIKEMALNAILIALIVLFTFIPNIGFITLGPISFTDIHIFVLLGALIGGWKMGLITGLTFGLSSLFRSISSPSTLDFLFVNPFVSVLPRVLFGFLSGVIFDLLKKKLSPKKFKIMIYPMSGILAFLHGVLTLLCLYVFGILDVFSISKNLLGLEEIIKALNETYPNVWIFLSSFIALGNLGEVVLAILVVPTTYLIIYNISNRNKGTQSLNNKDINTQIKNDNREINDIKEKGELCMDYKKESKNYFEIATKTLQGIIHIDSVYDSKTITKEHPYGKGVAEAFAFMKDLATKDGFKVDMCEGRCIEISFGEGNRTIGVFAHLDEVPISGEWTYPPFSGEIHNDKMYGRGTSDDKGPAIAAYYALKLLKDHNLINGYKVKLVLGGDEERGSSCLKYYFDVLKKPQVDYGFTPDGDFPLIFGEKGIRDFTYKGKLDLGPVTEIVAGVAPNAVIDDAIVTLNDGSKFLTYLKAKKNLKYKVLDENPKHTKVEFIGLSAHGSLPEKGINAGLIMINCLLDCYKIKNLEQFANDYKDPYGHALGEYAETKYLGNTTFNVGMINYQNGIFSFVVNFRFPETVNSDEVFDRIESKSILPIERGELGPVVYFDPDKTNFIKVLSEVYVRGTGDTINKPMAIGGGTYAKEAKNIVAFGSHFPGKEDNIHSPNEKIDMEDFLGSIHLYADAMNSLGKMK